MASTPPVPRDPNDPRPEDLPVDRVPEPGDGATRLTRRQRIFDRLTPDDARVLPDLLRQSTVGGAVMLAATALALLWANLGNDSYEMVRQFHLGPLTIGHWASDGLLTIFFFCAGLELKREFVSGSLAEPSKALVPVIAAIGGMAMPALIFLGINLSSPSGHTGGWAIPMATDIAFALAVLAAVGSKLPDSLRAFLLTLAIVDDLGAILVIAFVFTSGINLLWLAGALGCAALWWFLQRRRIEVWWLYVPLFVATWWCMHACGVHATIAGVLLGLLTRSSADDPNDPVDRWEHRLQPLSAGVVVPFFALMSAGVVVNAAALREVFTSPVGLGIILGLVFGKQIGVFGGAYLTARFTRAELAEDLHWRDVYAVSILAGVGFTVAIFVSELAFEHPLVDSAKAAVLIASLLAAVLATLALRVRIRRREAAEVG